MFKAMYIAGARRSVRGFRRRARRALDGAACARRRFAARGTRRCGSTRGTFSIVTDAEDGGVDVDYERSNANLDKIVNDAGTGEKGAGRILMATGFHRAHARGRADDAEEERKRLLRDHLRRDAHRRRRSRSGRTSTACTRADPRRKSREPSLPRARSRTTKRGSSSYFGANVLHPRTTLPAMRYTIPIVLRQLLQPSRAGNVYRLDVHCPRSRHRRRLRQRGRSGEPRQGPRHHRRRVPDQRRGYGYGRCARDGERGVQAVKEAGLQRGDDFSSVLGALHLLCGSLARGGRGSGGAQQDVRESHRRWSHLANHFR